MLIANYTPYRLIFKKPSRTSRALMHDKITYFIEISDDCNPEVIGRGEVALFEGLSADDTPEFEQMLADCCLNINHTDINRIDSSAIRFGFETALSDLANGGCMRPFKSSDNIAITINGLVWMNDAETMLTDVWRLIDSGFRCIKLKVGAIDFEAETNILHEIRKSFSAEILEIRLDANGAFTSDNVMSRLDAFVKYDVHSIEQPIKAGQPEIMAEICSRSPIPIALDEELIGIKSEKIKCHLLDTIKPDYIILKPSLCGGFSEADRWITAARERNIGWWATSALESNIGLNAIARWVSKYSPVLPQGLGTGSLYTNNIASPWLVEDAQLKYDSNQKWQSNIHYI